jgi:hypothetical protein
MQEKVSGKLNYLGQYFAGLVLMQRPVKNRALRRRYQFGI